MWLGEARLEGHARIQRQHHVPGWRRWRRHVGRMTSRRPTRSTWNWVFHASAQSASRTIRVVSSPIGRNPKACRWPSATSPLRWPFGRRRIEPGRYARTIAGLLGIDDGTEPLIGQPEARLDAGPARREPGQDLADRLDGLDVGGDRKLKPRPSSPRSGGSAASAAAIAPRGPGCRARAACRGPCRAARRPRLQPTARHTVRFALSRGHPSPDRRCRRPAAPPRPTRPPAPRAAGAAASRASSAR